MDIVYRKTGFKRDFSRFLMYKYFEKTIIMYLKAKNSLHTQQDFLALDTYLSSFSKKSDAKTYLFLFFFHKIKLSALL